MGKRLPKILAFAGSLRTNSYNKQLVKIALQGAVEAGSQVTYIDLKDYPLPIYDQDIEASSGLPPHVLKLKQLFLENDAFLIASPEYNGSLSGVLKNTIDWVSRPATADEVYLCCFIDKIIALMSASSGNLGGIRGLVHARAIFGNLYSLVLPYQKCIAQADKAFDENGNLKDLSQQTEVLNLGKRLAEFVKLHIT